MSDEKRKTAGPIKRYFAPDEKPMDFMKELRALTDEDKVQLADGIENGSLTY